MSGLPVAELDLLNALTAAQEIAAAPSGRAATVLARQIIEDCMADDELVALAEAVRDSQAAERANAARQLAAYVREVLGGVTPTREEEITWQRAGASWLAYDLEILRALPPADGKLLAGIEYCTGWTDYAGQGIACLCAQDEGGAVYRLSDDPAAQAHYGCESLAVFGNLIQTAEALVSFNGLRFDNQVLAANGIIVPPERCYDLMIEGWRGQGLDGNPTAEYLNTRPPEYRGGLNDYAEANLGRRKSGTGDQAPIRWQRGEYEAVLEYCALDVELTAELFRVAQDRGWLSNPQTGRRAEMRPLLLA